jgi:GNAT superfamily N-acetyltransferase
LIAPSSPLPTVHVLDHQQADTARAIHALIEEAHHQESAWLGLPPAPSGTGHWTQVQRSGHLHLGMWRAAEESGRSERLIGVLALAPDDEPGQLCIHVLAVHAEEQRKGVATALLQDALARAPGRVWAVAAAAAHHRALALYRQAGFVPYRQGVMGPDALPMLKLRRAADVTGAVGAA